MRELFSAATWKIIFPAWLSSRLWVALWVYIGHMSHPYLEVFKAGYPGVDNWWLNPWTTFDSAHFLHIAREGYYPLIIAFFPLYPGLLQLAGSNLIFMTVWGIVLSNAAFMLALGVFLHLTRLDLDDRKAQLAVWILAFFPTAAFFSAVYTESLFLFLLLSAFWCARREQWMWGGAWGFAAAATRNSGPMICISLLMLYFWDQRAEFSFKKRAANLSWLWLFLPLISFLLVQTSLASHSDGKLTGVNVHGYYGRSLQWPWIPLWHDFVNITTGRTIDLTTTLNFGFTILALVVIFSRRSPMPLSYRFFTFSIVAMQFIYGRSLPPYSNSSARFLSTTFPFEQRLAQWLDELCTNRFRTVIVVILYLSICAVQSFLFGQKSFLG